MGILLSRMTILAKLRYGLHVSRMSCTRLTEQVVNSHKTNDFNTKIKVKIRLM